MATMPTASLALIFPRAGHSRAGSPSGFIVMLLKYFYDCVFFSCSQDTNMRPYVWLHIGPSCLSDLARLGLCVLSLHPSSFSVRCVSEGSPLNRLPGHIQHIRSSTETLCCVSFNVFNSPLSTLTGAAAALRGALCLCSMVLVFGFHCVFHLCYCYCAFAFLSAGCVGHRPSLLLLYFSLLILSLLPFHHSCMSFLLTSSRSGFGNLRHRNHLQSPQ